MKYKAENGEHSATVKNPQGEILCYVSGFHHAQDIANELNSLLADKKRMDLIRDGWYISKSAGRGFYITNPNGKKDYFGKTVDEAFDVAIEAQK